MRRQTLKYTGIFTLTLMLYQFFWPIIAYGVTSGPSQPEVESYKPIGMDNLVDPFTGNFSYSIPLLEIDGFPVELAYSSGKSMEQEASWVGFGWNLNTGVISREKRGLPDDFKGDEVIERMNIKDDVTYTISSTVGLEVFGFETANLLSNMEKLGFDGNLNLGIKHNNKKGISFDLGISPMLSASESTLGLFSANMGLSANFNTIDGADVTPTLSLSGAISKETDRISRGVSLGSSIGLPYSTRAGLRSVSISNNVNYNRTINSNFNISTSKASGKAVHNFVSPVFAPAIPQEMVSESIIFQGKVGGEIFGAMANIPLRGSWSETRLNEKERTMPAYGYLYIDEGQGENALFPVEREKDGVVDRNGDHLHVPSLTHDIYTASGPNLGGTFRAHRNDPAVIPEPFSKNNTSDRDYSLEAAVGNFLHAGLDVVSLDMYSQAGAWRDLNNVGDNWVSPWDKKFVESQNQGVNWENTFFRNNGELLPIDEEYYESILGNQAAALELESNFGISGKLLSKYNSNNLDNVYRNKEPRRPRKQNFTFLTAEEASLFGRNTMLKSYDGFWDNGEPDIEYIGREERGGKPHHISEITITGEDGNKYVFGLPAYNRHQKDVTFNASDKSPDCENGLIGFDDGVHNDTSNTSGEDHYFNSRELPPYAHSWMLTEIITPDHQPIEGYSLDRDPGNSVRFKYTLAAKDHKWRTPTNDANYDPGFFSSSSDQKGSYIYGEKDLWYLHSIHGHNHIAEFHLEPREDGYQVAGEEGGVDLSESNRSMKLKKIKLYNKEDRFKNGSNAVPIKTVHFEYTYELVEGVPRNISGGGKLTLKRVYTTQHESDAGKTNYHEFHYNSFNPPYMRNAQDRWGTYSSLDLASVLGVSFCQSPLWAITEKGDFAPDQFPYVDQSNESLDMYASAWHLDKIKLPSGGVIMVDYEAKDYAYVQDKRAMEMTPVLATGSAGPVYPPVEPDASVPLFSPGIGSSETEKLYLTFPLRKPIEGYSKEAADKYVKGRYFGNMDQLYFRFFMNLMDGGIDIGSIDIEDEFWDFVPGYTQFDEVGVIEAPGGSNGIYEYGYVKLKKEEYKWLGIKQTAHPISKTAWQFLRFNLPHLYYGYDIDGGQDLESFLKSMVSFADEMKKTAYGVYGHSKLKGYGNHFAPEYSFIRLKTPYYSKVGGGARVSSISIYDSWDEMTNTGEELVLGQTYKYTKTKEINGQIEEISSGVAAYEPMIGNDENPFRQPIFKEEENLLMINREYFMEEPYGESFFPAPVIGYSRVEIKNIKPQEVEFTGTGRKVKEFYTSKDFPIITNNTPLQVRESEQGFWEQLITGYYFDFSAFSMGYIVENNDMHGQIKKVSQYAEYEEEPFSIDAYHYKTTYDEQDNAKRLSNIGRFVDREGKVFEQKAGIESDIYIDLRGFDQYSRQTERQYNIDIPFIMIIPPIIPSFYPRTEVQDNRMRTAVVSKNIMRYAILDSVTHIVDGSRTVSHNILRDEVTGDPVLTSIQNEFGSTLYTFDFPAHWKYEDMGAEYGRQGLHVENVPTENGRLAPNPMQKELLKPGDEVIINANGNPYHIWLIEDKASGHDFLTVNRFGQDWPFINNVDIIIINPVESNQIQQKAGQIVTTKNPVINEKLNFDNDVVQASFTEYSDEWNIKCQRYPYRLCHNVHDSNIFHFQDFLNELVNIELLVKPHMGDNDEYNNVDPINFDFTTNQILKKFYEDVLNEEGLFHFYWALNDGKLDSMHFQEFGGNELKLHKTLDTLSNHFRGYFGADAMGFCKFDLFTESGREVLWTRIDSFANIRPSNLHPNQNTFLIDVYQLGASEPEVVVGEVNDCIQFFNCSEIDCGFDQPYIVNPYYIGKKGNWRVEKSYFFNELRTSAQFTSNHPDLRNDGHFENFTPFWEFDDNSSQWVRTEDDRWQWHFKNTLYGNRGTVIEGKDALGRYQSSLLGFKGERVIAHAQNAAYHEIAFDAMQDYNYREDVVQCNQSQWNFQKAVEDNSYVTVTDEYSHSGKYSLKVESSEIAQANNSIEIDQSVEAWRDSDYQPNMITLLQNENCINRFRPEPGKSYVFSAWVKEGGHQIPVFNYDDAEVKIQFFVDDGSHHQYIVKPEGKIINGWQRMEKTVKVPENAFEIVVYLVSPTGSEAYFDDMRFHPENANMRTYVYDPLTLKVITELDENNYATWYQYNEEGRLTSVKIETEHGVQTVQEARYHRSLLNFD